MAHNIAESRSRAAKVLKLKAQLSNQKSKGEDDRVAIGRLIKQNNTLCTQITTLRAQLAKHGGHLHRCRVANGKLTYLSKKYRCIPDCGWAEIAKGE